MKQTKYFQEKKPKADTKKPSPISREEQDRIDFIDDCVTKGLEYRSRPAFKPTWDEIEAQINQVPPASWANKADWQTTIYIPLQANGSETGFSKFKKILFSSNRMMDIMGVEEEDKKRMYNLKELLHLVLDEKFESENNSGLQEAVDFGSGLFKVLAKPSMDGVTVTWRSVYNVVFDPSCGNDFYKSKWAIDEFTRDISEIIKRSKEKDSLYKKSVVERILKDAATEADIQEQNQTDTEKDLTIIKSMDGTTDVTIPSAYKTVRLYEWWGQMKVPVKDETDTKKGKVKPDFVKEVNYTLEWRVVTMAIIKGNKYILRDDHNEYEGIPFVMGKLKPRKFEAYGKGYLLTGMGLQELACSMINLGFDSEKLNSLDSYVVDSNAVIEWPLKLGPNEINRLNNINGIKPMRDGRASALVEIVTRGLPFIDQMYQDATSLTRHAQGSMALPGSGKSETLGEYQQKLMAIDEKFLAQAKIYDATFCKPLFRLVYRIITNPKLFTQAACDRILGVDETVEQKQVIDPETNEPVVVENVIKTPRLVLKELDKNMNLDFSLIGVTHMQDSIEAKKQSMEFLELISKFPMFAGFVKPYQLLKNTIRSMQQGSDVDKVIKTEEEVEQEQQEGQITQQLVQAVQAMAMIMQKSGLPIPPEIGQMLMQLQQQQQGAPQEGVPQGGQ